MNESEQPLEYCPWLSNFAQIRFNTMIKNPEISHYGYDQDYEEYFSRYFYVMGGEEVFYPSGYSPDQYVQDLINNAPLHWEELMNSEFYYYGYYIGNGPTIIIIGNCPVTEVTGPNINVSQYFESYGCQIIWENSTWLVIELSNQC